MSGLNPSAAVFTPGGFGMPKSDPPKEEQEQKKPNAQPPAPEDKPQPKTISLSTTSSASSSPAPTPAPPAAVNDSTKTSSSSTTTTNSTPASKPTTPAASKPATPAPAPSSTPAPAAASAAAKSSASKPSSNAASGSSTPTAASQTSSAKIAEDITNVADKELVQDLYGNQPIGKEHMNLVFIGHVDAGKSTMGGNLLYLCGMVDKRTMEKLEKEAKDAGRESWYLSWALDSTPQERSQGKTVEVGRAFFETDQRRYTILDAPGHKTYVPSMISGAAQADVAILVVSSRKGEFETGFERGGQTREHAMLVKTAGVQRLIIAVNKMDDPTVGWEEARYEEIQSKLTPFIKQAGFNPKTDVTYIPVSAQTGVNLKERVSKDAAPWYNGPSLLEHLDNMVLLDRKINAPLMMPISEKYNDMGTKVVGKIESGQMRKGQSVLMMPNRIPVEISSIFDERDEKIDNGFCGDNVRVLLRGVNDDDVTVGFVLSDKNEPVHAVRRFEAQLAILDHKNIITAGYGAIFHAHTLAEEVSIVALLHYYDKKTGRKSKRPPQFAKKGQKVLALLEVPASVCIEKFDDLPQMGRFTLRDEGKTVAIGKVTKLIQSEDDLSDMAKLSIAGAPASTAKTVVETA